MKNQNLSSPAWLLHGLTGSTEGDLTLRNQRISFADKSGALVFYVPLGEVRDIKFPWHLFGCGLTFVIGPNNYRISFARPGNTRAEADFGDVAQGRENCRAWKAALTS